MAVVNLQRWRNIGENMQTYKEKYSLVQIVLHTATADTVYEMMNKGLVDIALFLELVDTEGLGLYPDFRLRSLVCWNAAG